NPSSLPNASRPLLGELFPGFRRQAVQSCEFEGVRDLKLLELRQASGGLTLSLEIPAIAKLDAGPPGVLQVELNPVRFEQRRQLNTWPLCELGDPNRFGDRRA